MSNLDKVVSEILSKHGTADEAGEQPDTGQVSSIYDHVSKKDQTNETHSNQAEGVDAASDQPTTSDDPAAQELSDINQDALGANEPDTNDEPAGDEPAAGSGDTGAGDVDFTDDDDPGLTDDGDDLKGGAQTDSGGDDDTGDGSEGSGSGDGLDDDGDEGRDAADSDGAEVGASEPEAESGEEGSEEGDEDSSEENSNQEEPGEEGGSEEGSREEGDEDGEQNGEEDSSEEGDEGSEEDDNDSEEIDAEETTSDDADEDDASEAEEGSEPEPEFDEYGKLKALEEVEDAAEGTSKVSEATEIVNEARQLSTRLGELAQEIVDRQQSGEPATESFKAVIDIALESIQDHANELLDTDIDIKEGDSPYDAALIQVFTRAQRLLNEAARFTQSVSEYAASERLTALREVLAETDDTIKELAIDDKVAQHLQLDGSLDLDQLRFAGRILNLTQELADWLRQSVGPYLQDSAKGNRPLFPTPASALLGENAEVAARLRESFSLVSEQTSVVLPGNKVLALQGETEKNVVLTLLPVTPKVTLPNNLVLPNVEKASLEGLINEVMLYTKAGVRMNRVVNTLRDVINNLHAWYLDTRHSDQDSVEALRLEHLIPTMTTPVLDVLYYSYAQLSAIDALFTTIKDQHAGSSA